MKYLLDRYIKKDFIIKLIFAIILLSVFFCSVFRYFNHDEFESIHVAWKLIQGERIYIDFFEHHHPFFYYLLMPFIKIFGEISQTAVYIRIFMFIVFLAILRIAFLITREVYGDRTALISSIFLSSAYIFFSKAIEIRPDAVETFFILSALLLFLIYARTRNQKYLIFSSLCLVSSFLLLQKAIFFIILFFGLLIILVRLKKINLIDLLKFGSTCSLILAFFLLMLVVENKFSSYLFYNWTLNKATVNNFYPFEYFGDTFAQNSLLWILFIVGMILYSKSQKSLIIAFFSVGLLASLFFFRTPFPQYFMPIMPFVSMIAANAFTKLIPEKYFITGLILIIASPLFFLFQDMKKNNFEQKNKIDYVVSITDKNDYVYDGDIQFNLYRKDIDYFWFSLEPKKGMIFAYQNLRGYEYDPYKLISLKKPKVISGYFLSTKQEIISQNYYKSGDFDKLYILKNY
jgi:4-amino-4-deoxy-L-arabinose transferase-like glycosyltransferase